MNDGHADIMSYTFKKVLRIFFIFLSLVNLELICDYGVS